MNTNTVATNYDLVQQKITNTKSSRDEMISSLENLKRTIENTTQWQGPDAEKHKAALIDFCIKLKNSANWMEAAGKQAIDHSNSLKNRALEDARYASRMQ